jgi:hypothetical protein
MTTTGLFTRLSSLFLLRLEETNMVVYKLYRHDQTEKPYLIGILPERRKDPERITGESVLNWGREVIGEKSNIHDLFFVPMEM